MNPALLMFGIQSVLRLGRAGQQALEQWARDEKAIFPALEQAQFNTEQFVNGYFNKAENLLFISGQSARYAEFWDGNAAKTSPSAIDALYTAAVSIEAQRGGDIQLFQTGTAAALVGQWDPAKGPLSPWARVILTAGDIALDYISTNPGILGAGSGAKLISAYAGNLAEMLPDDGSFGGKEHFAQRIFGVFLRAGLDTLSEHPDWTVSDEHLQQLIKSSVTPVVDAFPSSLADQLRWREVTDAIMGPAASAVLQTVAEHPEAFLGSDFASDKALGALTQALLTQASATGIEHQFTKQGLLGLYRAALAVAAEKPQLFVGQGPGAQDQLAKSLLSGFANVLGTAKPPFDGQVGVALAQAALTAVGDNVQRFAAADNAWEQTAADLLKTLVGSLSSVVGSDKPLHSVFSNSQLIELGRVLLTNIARTPSMVVGSDNEALRGVVVAVTSAMRADDDLLLNGDEWIQIARAAAQEAARNPGRLFKLDPADPDAVLAGKLITLVLHAASSAATNNQDQSVLFGHTLQQAIILVIRTGSGNPHAVETQLVAIQTLLQGLNDFVAANSARYGSQEWLRLFKNLLRATMSGGSVPPLTTDSADTLLKGAA